ncbi:MAG TPA: 16S rRNA (uracil(1498)-N(3))-methyltransferase [Stellaceae bacterium]|jgi:16S rRNA (uracil1498-N3)-methyltransferase|nr:16S rRNA (uracil(1498)-N(3))-methyltransferase [Stellaceae bacterium]
MTTPKAATRLYLPAALVEGGAIKIDAAQSHRLRHVLRLAVGAAVAGFNARDGEFACRITELSRNRGALAVETCLRAPEAEADLWLLFAPIKRLRLDWLIEKGAELGVGAFVPVMTARTQPERLNRERLLAHAIAAAEQSERLSVPEIRPLTPLAEVLGEWPPDLRLILCDETGGGVPIADALGELPAGAPMALLIGPEGGFAERELDALANLPFVTRAGLGPRVLRAETAALAALAVFQAIAGDWRGVRLR